jgi:hypothetical protein
MKIDINKKYRTKEGDDVKFLHRVPDGWPTQYPWRGIIGDGNQMSWTDDGRQNVNRSPNDYDLIEVREPREWTLAVAQGNTAYPDGTISESRTSRGEFSEFWVPVRVREIID